MRLSPFATLALKRIKSLARQRVSRSPGDETGTSRLTPMRQVPASAFSDHGRRIEKTRTWNYERGSRALLLTRQECRVPFISVSDHRHARGCATKGDATFLSRSKCLARQASRAEIVSGGIAAASYSPCRVHLSFSRDRNVASPLFPSATIATLAVAQPKGTRHSCRVASASPVRRVAPKSFRAASPPRPPPLVVFTSPSHATGMSRPLCSCQPFRRTMPRSEGIHQP